LLTDAIQWLGSLRFIATTAAGYTMYRAVTRKIEVTVTPKFLSERSSPENGYFF